MTKYGIIGCGMMGREHLRNIALLEDARVTAIFEPDPEMAREAQALAPEAEMLPSLEALLSHENLDCLVVASPNHIHDPQLAQIAETRPLPLLLEKPLFTDPARAHAVRNAAKAYPAPFWVAMEYRYMPVIAAFLTEVRKLQEAASPVRMLAIREHRFPFLEKVGDWNRFSRNSGGTLVEKCCHFFDLMRFVLQSEPVRLYASGAQDVNHLDETYEGKVPDILDNAFVVVDFACGARASLDLCMFAEGSKFQERISAVTPTSKVECNVPGPQRFWPQDRLGSPPTAELIVSPRHPSGESMVEVPVDPALLEAGDHNGSTFYQHERFMRAVRGEGSVEVTALDGWKAVMMGMAAHHSIATGEAVDMTSGTFAL